MFEKWRGLSVLNLVFFLLFGNLWVKKTNVSKHKPMYLRGDISVVDMGIDKATILKFVLHVSEFDGVVTAVLSWPVRQNRSVKCLMALWCWDLS